jgi:hypothetical protein
LGIEQKKEVGQLEAVVKGHDFSRAENEPS